jgi:hypothetical protein
MVKRTIKPAAGNSRVSAAAAKAAARFVYRDAVTGRFVVSEDEMKTRAPRVGRRAVKRSARAHPEAHRSSVATKR